MKLLATVAAWLLGIYVGVCLPAEVIIIRHGEKPDEPKAQHLSRRGEERAKALVGFFTKNPTATQNGLPVALFASEPTPKGAGQRPRETLQPLAKELHLPLQTPFASKDYVKLAEYILKSSKCDGKTVVICWVHEHMPALAVALGVTPEPPKWKEQVYDEAYVITYPNGTAHLKIVPEKILPGDSKYKE